MNPQKKTKLGFLAFFSAALALLAILNPSEKKHREAEHSYIIKTYPDDVLPYEADAVQRIVYYNCVLFSFTRDPGQKCIYGPPVKTVGFCGFVISVSESHGYG